MLFEPYEATIADATPLARKITGADPDILFAVSYTTDGVQLVRALGASGSDVPIVGGVGGFITPDFGNAIGSRANGIFSVTTSAPNEYGDIGERYKEKYGTFMPQEAHDNAAALSVIAQALEATPTTDPTELAKTLHSQDFDEGIAAQMPGGHVTFDEAGSNVVIEPLMVQWQDGRLVSVWPEELAEYKPRWPGQ
jgi:branched-chain amino acid transport system substrate-binding protein